MHKVQYVWVLSFSSAKYNSRKFAGKWVCSGGSQFANLIHSQNLPKGLLIPICNLLSSIANMKAPLLQDNIAPMGEKGLTGIVY